MQVTSAQQLPSGTTTLNFQVTDACGSTGTGTLTIVVTNVVSYGETTNAILFKERVYQWRRIIFIFSAVLVIVT